MAVYLEVQDAKYSTDQDEAINCLMTTQSEQAQRRDHGYRRYGKSDTGTGRSFYGSTNQFVYKKGIREYRRLTFKRESDKR